MLMGRVDEFPYCFLITVREIQHNPNVGCLLTHWSGRHALVLIIFSPTYSKKHTTR